MAETARTPAVAVSELTVRDRSNRVILDRLNASFPAKQICCVLGPSGAGKTTLLRCINRLVDLTPDLEVSGRIELGGQDVRDSSVDVDDLRRRVGIVFQRPVTFAGSIQRNVVFAAKRIGLVPSWDGAGTVEECLRAAHLWDEVSDRLRDDACNLSVGQQQRLAIARTLAGQPEVILMDEPTSALDSASTERLESTILSMRGHRTVILVTHDEAQADRLADVVLELQ